MTIPDLTDVHPAWLPAEAFRAVGSRHTVVHGDGMLVDTVFDEVERACAAHGGTVRRGTGQQDGVPRPAGDPDAAPVGAGVTPAQLVFALVPTIPAVAPPGGEATGSPDGDPVDAPRAGLDATGAGPLGPEGFAVARHGEVTVVLAEEPAGLLYGLFEVVRLGEAAFGPPYPARAHRPAMRRRMLDHWDNVDVHPVMGQVERGYAGGSIFWRDGRPRRDHARLRAYARLLAACGVNAVSVNNVNVHATEARLLTERLDDVAEIADVLRPYGIRVHLSVTFAAPVVLDALPTADPLDDAVRAWWAETTRRVYARIPDFGGFVVKADSEGQPGPFSYGRDHADGANLLAQALDPYDGVVHWRAFVYNHRQDWRDRSTDRARAAHDHFALLDGRFRDNVIVQVKHGPMDFQTREPVSPVITAMPGTRLAVEFQVTQEYTGQQRHVCYLAPWWSEVLRFGWGEHGRTVAGVAAAGGDLVGVSNVGDDPFWTGHPLAQANLYAFGRLAWDPRLTPQAVLDEWIDLTFDPAATADPELLRGTLHEVMDDSWRSYERYTAPLGVGFMVRPGHHYGPDVDGYEYTSWGTYHFADRDGVGVDRTRATGTGFTGQYPPPWSQVYESLASCPDELLLFFHHVPYGHLLHSGGTVIQHIYDTHFDGMAEVAEMCRRWKSLAGLVDAALHARVTERLDEQLRCAQEWCDQINAYFYRRSGIPDAHGRTLY
ncbi:alpha-glucuronidase [Micromonospora phaseoli]|uniref:Alpha-glucuronidase n=1 Tax=Micromonospora phaseoli TaxID=1144548 RepID=A0A1H6VEE8_9ACTN|nr:alpha-glucuronidase [Micromonospora phaseoli]PZV93645.1 alpha-glucuronidase [Micromonospora phaseoli]GIJ79801.1 xylan alpha-(1->2)-glucuronosidase [Micromonospora phaseoli]SEJ01364.1 alpha-glucuronidase [Micromonospora phaseoli]